MEPLTTLVLLAMLFNLLENTFVAVVAIIIYLRQTTANYEMEQRINKGIADVKKDMRSEAVLGNLKKTLKKDILKTMNGWVGGKKGGITKTGKNLAGMVGNVQLMKNLKQAKTTEDRAWILGEYAMQKYAENLEKKEATAPADINDQEKPTPDQEPIVTIDAYKTANMDPEEYKREYEAGLKIVKEREANEGKA